MNCLTETERMTLKHILKMSDRDINIFESLNLENNVRSFIIFDIMLKSHDKQRKKFENKIAELQNNKIGFFKKIFKN